MTSSSSYNAPVILTDSLLSQCFMGGTNVPLDVLRLHDRGDPRGTERLMALTIPVTNVTLKIDHSYPFSNGPKPDPDVRDHKRITDAVERLFGKAKKEKGLSP